MLSDWCWLHPSYSKFILHIHVTLHEFSRSFIRAARTSRQLVTLRLTRIFDTNHENEEKIHEKMLFAKENLRKGSILFVVEHCVAQLILFSVFVSVHYKIHAQQTGRECRRMFICGPVRIFSSFAIPALSVLSCKRCFYIPAPPLPLDFCIRTFCNNPNVS